MFHIDLKRFPFEGPIYFQELTQYTIDEHDHSFYEIAVVLSGSGWHQSEGQFIPVQPLDAFIIPIGTPHCWVRNSNIQLLNIYYKASDFLSLIGTVGPLRSLFFASDFDNPHLRPSIHLKITRETLAAIRYELQEMQAGAESCPGPMFQAGCFLKVLSRLSYDYASYYGISERSAPLRPAVHRLMERLDQHALMGEPLNLELESALFGISGDQLTRVFRESVAVSPYKFFNQRRLVYARMLLGATSKTCTEIAHELGFSDSAHFSRTFREHFGISPMEWRKLHAEK